MFGYVLPSAQRLSGEDEARFRAAYCGLCRVLGERYGLAARFILNYDFTFLALLLWPAEGERPVAGPASPTRSMAGTASHPTRPWNWRRIAA